MNKIKNFKLFNLILIAGLSLMILVLICLILLDANNMLYDKYEFVRNLNIDNWTNIIGAILGIFATVGVTMFFYNKNEILKIKEDFFKRWNDLGIINNIYLDVRNTDYLQKSDAKKYIIKYDMKNYTHADLYKDIENYNLLCDLLDSKNERVFENSITTIYFPNYSNIQYASYYFKEYDLLIIEKNIDFIFFRRESVNLLDKVKLRKLCIEENDFICRHILFFEIINKERYIDKIQDMKDISSLIDCLKEYKKMYTNNIFKSITLESKFYSSETEVETLLDFQGNILKEVLKWTEDFNEQLVLKRMEAIENKNYEILESYYTVLKAYRYFIDDVILGVTSHNELDENYKIQTIDYKNSLNSSNTSDVLFVIDRKLVENINMVYEKINKIS